MNINTAINAAPNQVRRFILENQPVRGYWVDLDKAWQALRAHQQYTPAVRNLLGEAVSASVLLAATLKFEGTLTLQLEGKGDVRLLVAQCSNDFKVRAVARLSDEAASAAANDETDSSDADASESGLSDADSSAPGLNEAGRNGAAPSRASSSEAAERSSTKRASPKRAEAVSGVFDLGPLAEGAEPFAVLPKAADALAAASFRELVGENGRVIVTIEGGDNGMRYQGIVPLDGDSLAECLESYFASSEQLPTRLRLAANGERTVGLLLQKLPEHGGAEVEEGSPSALAWQDAERGIAAVRSTELVGASLQSVLEARFGQRDVRVF